MTGKVHNEKKQTPKQKTCIHAPDKQDKNQ